MAKYIVKIKNNSHTPHKQNAVFGVSLSGGGTLDSEKIRVCLGQLNKYKHVSIILHGNEEQSYAWLSKNDDSLKQYKDKFTVIHWCDLQSNSEYKKFYTDIYLKHYNDVKNEDFRCAIEKTVNEFLVRHNEILKSEVLDFVLEEMAFLMKFALDAVPDQEPHCFIYPSSPLDAFNISREVFLTEDKVNLMNWVEIDISINKNLDIEELWGDLLKDGNKFNRYAEELNGTLFTFNSLMRSYTVLEQKMSNDLKRNLLAALLQLQNELNDKMSIIYSNQAVYIVNNRKNDNKKEVKDSLSFENTLNDVRFV